MKEYKELINKIQELRKYMNKLVTEKNSLMDPEIIETSKKIDSLLNDYEKMINERNS